MTQSRVLSPVSKHDPSVVGEHMDGCVQVKNSIGETADTLQPEKEKRDFFEEIQIKRYINKKELCLK